MIKFVVLVALALVSNSGVSEEFNIRPHASCTMNNGAVRESTMEVTRQYESEALVEWKVVTKHVVDDVPFIIHTDVLSCSLKHTEQPCAYLSEHTAVYDGTKWHASFSSNYRNHQAVLNVIDRSRNILYDGIGSECDGNTYSFRKMVFIHFKIQD